MFESSILAFMVKCQQNIGFWKN